MSQIIKRLLTISVFVVVLVTGLLFFIKNNQRIEFNYLLGSVELPVSLVLLLSLCAGVLLGLAASVPVVLRLRRQKLKLQKQIRNTETEINNLRVLPIREPH